MRLILVCVMFMISLVGSMFLILYLLLLVFCWRLPTHSRIHLFKFSFKVLHTRYPIIFLPRFTSLLWHVLEILLELLIGPLPFTVHFCFRLGFNRMVFYFTAIRLFNYLLDIFKSYRNWISKWFI
jgi:hypothetical protein